MKRMIIFIICIVVLILPFISCQNKKNETPENSTTTARQSETNPEETTSVPLPEHNFGGYKFRILLNGPEFGDYRAREFAAEAETGEVMNDAVYRRNAKITEAYNFEIVITDKTSWSNPVEVIAAKLIKAGLDEYDLVMPMINQAPILAQQNMLLDLKNINAMNLTGEWWDQRANEQLQIGKKLYFTTGDISILDNYCTFGILFNKDLIKQNELADPYELVKTGKWTIDAMYDIAKKITHDINGDGKLDHEDLWGVLSETNSSNGMFFSSGEHIVEHDSDGYLKITMYNERSAAVMEKAFNMLHDKDNVIFADEM